MATLGPDRDPPSKGRPAPTETLVDDDDRGDVTTRAPPPAPPLEVVNEPAETSSDRLPDEPLRLGQLVPGTRYRIEKWLGQGSTGVVLEAAHIDIERRVAIKILRFHPAAKSHKAETFRREARTASRIGSAHITQVVDFGSLPDGRLFYAMELVEGTSLAALVRHSPIDPGRLVAILRQVCKALTAAHAAGVLHRDIKPENILLTQTAGREDFVKVGDFGIATALADGRAVSTSIVGTPFYMAPEQALGEACGPPADLYSLGCTAYELLAGRPPFGGSTVSEVLQKHATDQPPPLLDETGAPLAPEPLLAVIEGCLAKDPGGRPQTADALELALCEAQVQADLTSSWDDLPLPDGAGSGVRLKLATPHAEQPVRRWRAIALGAVVLGLAATGYGLLNRPSAETTDSPAAVAAADIVEELAGQARDAAARAYFVYPPADAPKRPTAFTKVVELEGIETARAAERALTLRAEFADTLVRLGDYYWGQLDGKPFAIDYYAQALMFRPDDAHALSRALMTSGELRSLRHKAQSREFSEGELEAAEALVVLAEPDQDERRRRLRRMLDEPQPRARTSRRRLETIVDEPADGELQPPEDAATGDAGGAPTLSPPATQIAEAQPLQPATEQKPAPVERDPKAAAAEVAAGNKALGRGDARRAEQHFHRALEADPGRADALIGVSDARFERADYDGAAKFARKATRRDPRRARYQLALGDALFKLVRYAEAKRAYERARKLGHPDAEKRLSRVAAKLGE